MTMPRFTMPCLAAITVAGLFTVLPVHTASAATDDNPLVEIVRELGGIVGENQEGLVAGLIDISRELTGTLTRIID